MPDNSATGSEAVVSETNIRLRAQSNWLRHSLNLEASGGFRKSSIGRRFERSDIRPRR